jgi:hypothetical protein
MFSIVLVLAFFFTAHLGTLANPWILNKSVYFLLSSKLAPEKWDFTLSCFTCDETCFSFLSHMDLFVTFKNTIVHLCASHNVVHLWGNVLIHRTRQLVELYHLENCIFEFLEITCMADKNSCDWNIGFSTWILNYQIIVYHCLLFLYFYGNSYIYSDAN